VVIGGANAVRLASLPELEVIGTVVVSPAVDVMHVLVRLKRAPDLLLHDVAVVEHPLAVDANPEVAVAASWNDRAFWMATDAPFAVLPDRLAVM
jgi:hypothetical protein